MICGILSYLFRFYAILLSLMANEITSIAMRHAKADKSTKYFLHIDGKCRENFCSDIMTFKHVN